MQSENEKEKESMAGKAGFSGNIASLFRVIILRGDDVMKNILIIVLVFCLTLPVLAACGPKTVPTPTVEPAPTEEPAAVIPTEEPAAPEKASLANPWTETDPAGLMEKLGLSFKVPEDAKDVIYRMNESEKMAEMRFTLNDMPFTARIKPVGTEFEDISGLYYQWDNVQESSLRWTKEKIMKVRTGEKTIEAYLWFDVVPGLMYSLSTEGADLDGFDIVAVADMICERVQGDA